MSGEFMVYLMFIAKLSEVRVFKLLPMITPYSDKLFELFVLFTH